MRFIIIIVLLFSSTISSQINKVLISGIAGYESHDEDVKNAFLLGYASYNGTEYTGEIFLYPHNLNESFQYASNNGYQVIIRSTTGLTTGIHYAEQNSGIKLIMPAGSNSFVQAYSGDIQDCPVIVTGAGVSENKTGYNIDFYSIDPITDNNYSSFSNGYVAGQIAFIANSMNCSIDEARIKARESGSEKGVWDANNGYGAIDVGASLSALPVELTAFTGKVVNKNVILNWTTATEVNNYGFSVLRLRLATENEWDEIAFVEGHGNSNSTKEYSFVDPLVTERSLQMGAYSRSYKLKQIDTDGSFEYSDVVTVDGGLAKTELYQNYPNPFNPTTKISFELSEAGLINVSVYNIRGQKIAELLNKRMNAGTHNVKFDASNLSSGLYIYKLDVSALQQTRNNVSLTNSFTKTMKMVLLK